MLLILKGFLLEQVYEKLDSLGFIG